MVLGFFAISVYAGIVSYLDFQTRYAGDLAIFMQSLSSTIRGHPTPFYESYDCMVKTRCSFLLVHPSLVLYAIVPGYAVAPSAVTLFVVQSLGVALAAVPLFLLTRSVTGSATKGLLAAGLFLVWAPTLSGEAFSFHMEPFLPLEMFTLAFLWQSGRYRSGLLVALLSFLTIEIAPVFTFLLGVFFLFPLLERHLRVAWSRWRRDGAKIPLDGSLLRRWTYQWKEALRLRGVRYSLVLLLASVMAYVLLYLFMNVFGARLLGVPSPPIPPGVGGIFYNSSSPTVQSIVTILHSAQTLYTFEFWVMLYALVAFIPLLSPRALILSVPWIGWTFLTDSNRYVEIGTQYTLIAAAPLFLGLAYGLLRVPLTSQSTTAHREEIDETQSAGPIPHARSVRNHWRPARRLWVGALTAAVIANVIIVPLNPLLSDLGITLQSPFGKDYQDHSATIIPGYAWAESLIGIIPRDATVTAPGEVFPILANYPDAYVLLGRTEQNRTGILPLNLSGGVDFVLLYESYIPSLSPGLSANLTNSGLYGLRGYVASTGIGPLLLYERGYSGAATLFGPPVPSSSETYSPGDGIVSGRIGEIQSDSSAPYGKVVETRPGSQATGQVWSGPGVLLGPGTDLVTVRLAASNEATFTAQSRSFLTMVIEGFGDELVDQPVPASDFSSGLWTTLTYSVNVTRPLPDLDVEGYLTDGTVALQVGAVSIASTP
jgi:uncharacterized membrane protein